MQRILRERARKEREGGKKVKIGYRKMYIEGEMYVWNEEGEKKKEKFLRKSPEEREEERELGEEKGERRDEGRKGRRVISELRMIIWNSKDEEKGWIILGVCRRI